MSCKVFFILIVINQKKIHVAPPEATPSRFVFCSSLHVGSTPRPAPRTNSLRTAQHLFLKINIKLVEKLICCARGGAGLADEERGAAKPRGRGLGRRNRN